MNHPRIGGHVSVAGGLVNGITNAQRIGASCMQIFGSSPRQWKTTFPSQSATEEFKRLRKQYDINPVFLHASYLVNLSANDEFSRAKSIQSLSEHLRIAQMIDADGLIFHIGSKTGVEQEIAIERTVIGMQDVLRNVPDAAANQNVPYLIMENAASRKKVGATIEELAEIFRRIASPRVKLCLDTAHALEAGILSSYTPDEIDSLFNVWEEQIGMHHLVALHVNDSRTPYNSQHDRHENIGEGYIGIDGFRALAKEQRLHTVAWILEVPGFEDQGPDKRNINLLRQCVTS